MEELSIKQKAQKYDEALKVAKDIRNGEATYIPNGTTVIEALFPELQESDDEKIRKELIAIYSVGAKVNAKTGDIPDRDIVAWLEKQGEQKPKDKYTFNSIPRLLDMIEPTDRAKSYCQKLIDSLLQEGYVTDAKIVNGCLKQMNGEKIAMATMDEQKSTNKVEPKFKVGDWIVFNGLILHIDEVVNGYYRTTSRGDGIHNSYDWNIDNAARLWTIEDAKDGDVLWHSDSASNGIFIFKEIRNDGKVLCYCDYDSEDHFCLGEYHTCCWSNDKYIKPATKEQRDTLMKAMADDGYTFDFDRKELKKILNL